MIQVVSAIHGRRDIFAVFHAGIKRLQKHHPVSLHVVASDKEDAKLLSALGISHSLFDNQPLSDKWNHGVQSVIGKEWEHLLIMGSDNVLTTDGFLTAVNAKQRHIGFPECLYYEVKTGRAKLFDYRKMGTSRLMGAGRFLSRELVDEAWTMIDVACQKDYGNYRRREVCRVSEKTGNYLVGTKHFRILGNKKEGLWDSGLAQGLDLNLETRLAIMGAAPLAINKLSVCDFKTLDNLWRFDERPGDQIDATDFLSKLSEEERELIGKMNGKG